MEGVLEQQGSNGMVIVESKGNAHRGGHANILLEKAKCRLAKMKEVLTFRR